MGRDDAVGSAEQGIIRKHRFDADDIAAKAAQKSGIKCFAYGCLIYDRASCDIEKDGSALEELQGVSVDDLPGLRGQGAVK